MTKGGKLLTGTLTTSGREYRIIDLPGTAGADLLRMPWVHRILYENLLRRSSKYSGPGSSALEWLQAGSRKIEIPFHPGRILMHDTTCGPALVDIAASRAVLAEHGGDPERLSPVLPIDVSTDHSVAVDYFGSPDSLSRNMERELERNLERYQFMKWAARALGNVTVHPPGTGIMHTLNLERIATVVSAEIAAGEQWIAPDTLIGTDSHTPMINALGVLGWGVGGLEAEAVMFGMPVMMRIPAVVGVKLVGRPREGVLATDLALHLTSRLRSADLSNRFVEFFGPGVPRLSVGERAVIANMAPEYGSTTGYFPIDGKTLEYLNRTGRTEAQITLVRDYAQRQGLWFDPNASPRYDEVIEFDLSSVTATLAGPGRPQDLVPLDGTRRALEPFFGAASPVEGDDVPDAAVAIAAITSCTNTSDPRLVIAAGLLARNARRLGLRTKSWVKTTLAPGSPTAELYLRRSGLLEDLEALGFAIAGYGCTTCIGNSGALTESVITAIGSRGIVPVAILSGNRNFPGRVHPAISAAFLASPPLVVAFALAGDADRDIQADPIGIGPDGTAIWLADIWPSGDEIDAAVADAVRSEDYRVAHDHAEDSDAWRSVAAPQGPLYPWSDTSTYLRRPPFVRARTENRLGSFLAHPLLVLGDDVTTDHISPAGAIATSSEAGEYLLARNEPPEDLNVFSARRGNWEVMIRGLFTNNSVRNMLVPAIAPGSTVHAPTGGIMPLWRAAERYGADNDPVVVVAGDRYGTGSSRDWAAKGVALMGVRAVLATGFERIHRSNLVNMGILPLRLPPTHHPRLLALRPGDRLEVHAHPESILPNGQVAVAVRYADGRIDAFRADCEVETAVEADILRRGGLIPMIIDRHLVPGG